MHGAARAAVTRSVSVAPPSRRLRVGVAVANWGEKGSDRSVSLVAAVSVVKGRVTGQKGRLAISASRIS